MILHFHAVIYFWQPKTSYVLFCSLLFARQQTQYLHCLQLPSPIGRQTALSSQLEFCPWESWCDSSSPPEILLPLHSFPLHKLQNKLHKVLNYGKHNIWYQACCTGNFVLKRISMVSADIRKTVQAYCHSDDTVKMILTWTPLQEVSVDK
jgi:hypothetical protein